ncbi:MAG TPA: RidA family protein [Vicinamibacterales bacterium]|nr:RidA family protein [Vicinamibacterales bacterium]
MRQAVASDGAPRAIGPYSQAIRAGSLLFVSGQIPLDPATGAMVEGDIAVQTHQVFANLRAILEAAGATFDHVVRTTVYLADMNDFATVNEIYGTYFSSPAPARATVQAARLPKDARVEIDLIAAL